MPLRKRVSLVAGGAVAIAVAIASLVCYFVVRDQLRGQLDGQLKDQAPRVLAMGASALTGSEFPGLSASDGGRAPYSQIVATNGQVLSAANGLRLPVDAGTRAVARGRSNNVLEDATANGVAVRILTFHSTATVTTTGQTLDVAIQLARPLTSINRILSSLRLILFLLFIGGIAMAVILGRVAARRVLAPLSEVSDTAKTIGETDDLSLRLAVHADDEVGQLATHFNEMLDGLASSRAALDDSVRSQRQLVADASHELRTPVTSLRTNIEVLLAGGRLDDEDRRRLLADVVEQSEELSTLVSDLIEVARGDLPDDSMDDIRLDGVALESVMRARRNAPEVEFTATLQPVFVAGNAERLSRAINNLLDNAARHTAAGTSVEIAVDCTGVRVRDHGSGIGEDDLPYVFDRFYRGANSRARQGSGLGLAIVRQVAQSHGGTVSAANAPDGGAVFTLALPAEPVSPDEAAADDDGLAYGAGGLVTRA